MMRDDDNNKGKQINCFLMSNGNHIDHHHLHDYWFDIKGDKRFTCFFEALFKLLPLP